MGDMIWNITGGLCEDIDDLIFLDAMGEFDESEDEIKNEYQV